MPLSSRIPLVPRALRLLAVLVLISTGIFWATHGGRLGWSQNRVPVTQLDPITGIESISYVERYVPGFDFLLIGAGAALALFASSALPFFRKTPSL